jgi:hypothetical protein
MTEPGLIVPESVRTWLASGERGSSSETIVGRFLGLGITQYECEPSDPDDLRRCALMLAACPEVKAWLPKMASVSPAWKRLIDQWDELVALMWAEALKNGNQCPKTFKRMQRAVYG